MQSKATTVKAYLAELPADRREVIEAVRKEGNYLMVFDVSGQANQIVAADTSLDLTQRVIDRLKQAGPAAPASGAPRSG